ncbi:MAG: NUDIX hydrolase [Nanoarchaeota archaeon]|nr:NUDIX hydrolase [Nanoarchaeota archaeon]MBU1644071.1 NUDIX hydrolase [Nanoarchaeota archaeon]MBU1977313.1 NUDIX hydrolase [Nanoarchaeota archaeon]
MISEREPESFNPKIEVVSCLLEYGNEILLLHRQDYKNEGDKWGLPAGKIDKEDKNTLAAIVREVKEETGIMLSPKKVNYFKKFFVKYPQFDFIYHVFHVFLEQREEVRIREEEHKDYRWIAPEEALKLKLVMDESSSIKTFYNL